MDEKKENLNEFDKSFLSPPPRVRESTHSVWGHKGDLYACLGFDDDSSSDVDSDDL